MKIFANLIKIFTKCLFGQDKDSTAKVLLTELQKRGVLKNSITSRHIAHVYSLLRKLSVRPDFKSIDDILPNQYENTIHTLYPIWGVIVETRKHPALELVVNNFIKNVRIPIQIFHGNINRDFMMSTTIADLVSNGQVHLTQLNADKLSARKYNTLFLSKRFWKNVIGRKKILIFQTDTVVCGNSDYTIHDFVSYDYIGSKWSRHRPVGLIIDGGSGGLSLRDWGKTYECLSRFPSDLWCGGEDGYFAFHIELIGGKVGKDRECAKFSTQSDFKFKSWGGHKVSFLQNKAQSAFLDYCPEASFLINKIR
ncbi:MAG: hypothetical protein GY801_11870 [bacterium]|nr:hypothetical protein [bacterium]